MASGVAGESGFHTAHAAADDEHLFLGYRFGSSPLHVELAAGFGVNGAVGLAAGDFGGEAAEAAEAGTDFILPSGTQLDGQVGVGQKTSCHFYNVSLAGGYDLLQLPWLIAHGTNGGNGGADVLFDFRGKADIGGFSKEHTGMGHAEDLADFMAACADMDKVAVALQLLCKGYALFYIVAALIALAAGHTNFNGEVGANSLAYSVANGNSESGSVLNGGAAPFIGAGIERGREELLQKPTVAGMDENHAEARSLGGGSGLGVFFNGALNHGLVHGLNPASVQLALNRAIGLA